MKREDTIDFHFQRNWLKIVRYYNNEASEHGTSMTTGFILLMIDISNGTPSTKLGPMMGMEARSLVRPLKTLEENGLIKRVKDDHDGRLVKIFLTPEGIKARAIAKNTVIQLNTYLIQDIDPKKLEVFFEVMEIMCFKLTELDNQKAA